MSYCEGEREESLLCSGVFVALFSFVCPMQVYGEEGVVGNYREMVIWVTHHTQHLVRHVVYAEFCPVVCMNDNRPDHGASN